MAPATPAIGADGRGERAFGALQADLALEHAPTMAFLTWTGFDDTTDVQASGSAERLEDGSVKVEFSHEGGDEAVLKAHRR